MQFRQTRDIGEKKPTRYFSNIQETAVAKAIGGRKTSNSGATPYDKGDISDENFLYECKTCVKDQNSFTMKKEWFDKNLDESIFMKKDYNVVVFNFGPSSKNYYVIDEQTFIEMKEALVNQNNSKGN